MTYVEVLRLLANEIERREEAERQVEELKKQLEQFRNAMLAAKPAQWLSVKESAIYISKSRSWLDKDRLQRNPTIPYRQECTGGSVYYARSDLDAYSESRMRGRKKPDLPHKILSK